MAEQGWLSLYGGYATGCTVRGSNADRIKGILSSKFSPALAATQPFTQWAPGWGGGDVDQWLRMSGATLLLLYTPL
jgi:hypothetical protein